MVLQRAVSDAEGNIKNSVELRVLSDQICSIIAAAAPEAPLKADEKQNSSAATWPANLESHCGPEVPLSLRWVPKENKAAVGRAGGNVEPKVEHNGIELENLVEVAHERAIYGHSSSCPVQSEVIDAVSVKDVTFVTMEIRKRFEFRTLRRGSRARGGGARLRGL